MFGELLVTMPELENFFSVELENWESVNWKAMYLLHQTLMIVPGMRGCGIRLGTRVSSTCEQRCILEHWIRLPSFLDRNMISM